MSSIINTNLASLSAQSQLDKSRAAQSQAIQRLSSGLRINGASDDAAGLAIAARMSTQLRGLNVATRNAQDAISLSQTAAGSLSSISDNLQRMRELAVQSANSSNSASDRQALQSEVAQLADEIDRVATQANYNGQYLLDGSFTAKQFQVGPGTGVDQKISLPGLASARTAVLGYTAGAPTTPPPTTTNVTGSALSAASTITGAGQLVINGVDVYQSSAVSADAAQLSAAINAAGITGLTANAAANVLAGSFTFTASNISVSLSVNVAPSTFTSTFSATTSGSDRATTVAGIANGVTFGLGSVFPSVSGADNGDGVTITVADGSNITLGTDDDVAYIGFGGLGIGPLATPTTFYSHVGLSYTGSAGLTISGSKAAALGLAPMTPPPPPPGAGGTVAVGSVDISTVAGANGALDTLDFALDTVNAQRAQLGAMQNRFEAVIANTANAATNISAARSRITDADFAAETAKLASSNVLQQAASAIVAQANALSGDVLILLRA